MATVLFSQATGELVSLLQRGLIMLPILALFHLLSAVAHASRNITAPMQMGVVGLLVFLVIVVRLGVDNSLMLLMNAITFAYSFDDRDVSTFGS